ncbi:metallophosphoesterase [Jannaschia marina]|uniref:metallophosphoesterase n=1 Tax=Jannaschia marina TaxID=2741674 RepID=UPI0015CB7D8B|nr:metallophosphoesterase [Jannaschia marina]
MPYAVGDLHGYSGQLDRVLALIEADGGADAPVVFLGDYVDRGPDARGVLERLIAGRAAGRDWTCLLGNHDHLFLRFLQDGTTTELAVGPDVNWLHPRGGGATTLASYGLDVPFEAQKTGARGATARAVLHDLALAAVPAAHRAFLESCPRLHRTADHVFVHAGLRPGVPVGAQDPHDLIWIREPFLSDPRDHGALVVHGHTPLDAARHHGNRVNLDSGAGFGKPATVAWIEGRRAWSLTETGRVELTP